ncbi:Glycosyltransferase involved in cell wall bisynthesis [Desulfacinum hydrothermale DSM 13146]|uniref:Glycosyltransferase involved in cell wall bisynthesis n=1 Tax=Desulfacinum hydrothermale DSM 13146 TaxID=1121390 RepID=A0A1W1XET4_9BACT|nr:glycosyltransferase family 2 protein [Desulfacinum hydrothermale]SMC22453.1 Glycosyltransferase involved in cell wall bisynthesis [Desulfacinum hydrothermale DSM 13146]
MERGSDVSVVIPAYHEEGAIAQTVSRIVQVLPEAEVIVVDDGSRDRTAEEARRAGAYVWSHPYNIGNGAAVKTGIRMASRDKVVLMDGDGQHDPADLPRLLEAAETYDMVVGARDPASHANTFRRWANAAYNLLARYATRFPVKDLTSGYRVMDRETVLRYLYLLPNTFSYPTTLTLAYLRSGRSVCYVPIQAKKRKGKSKIKPLKDGVRFFLIILKITTLFSPLRIFLPVSGSFFLMGLANYAYTYLTAHRFTNMSALLFITSVLLFMLGLVSEQITQLRYDRVENGG